MFRFVPSDPLNAAGGVGLDAVAIAIYAKVDALVDAQGLTFVRRA
jgi:hypothetical protein